MKTFKEFFDQAWKDHGKNAEEVAGRFVSGIKSITTDAEVVQMTNLITHVYGEHLGKWNEGIATLRSLQGLPVFEKGSTSDAAVSRSIAVLEFASGQKSSLKEFSTSDQIRILAVAASALSALGKSDFGQRCFRDAMQLAESGLPKEDPANRALAVTGNNLACELEEKEARNQIETDLMILAAKTARKYWEIAGTWSQVQSAEYRLSNTFLKADDTLSALKHAQLCLEICQEHEAPAIDFFFGYEALSLVERARGNEIGFIKALDQVKKYFDLLSKDDQSWCLKSLQKITEIKH